MTSNNIIDQLFNAALETRKNSYSPYSNFAVGAAILTTNGEIFSGCNVENSSYGGAVCAERNAIFQSIINRGEISIDKVLVITDPVAVPCGFCLQVISEFATQQTEIILCDPSGPKKTYPFRDFMPHPFDKKSLPQFKNRYLHHVIMSPFIALDESKAKIW